MSKYFEQQLITASLVTPTFPGSGARHVALFTADPLDDPTTNPYEVNSATATWYGRVACASWQAAQTSGTTHTTSNQAVVTYDPVTGDSLTVSHFGIYDAETGGNLLLSGALTTSKTLSAGDVLTFAIGSLVLTFS
jgi:hypothetical protein